MPTTIHFGVGPIGGGVVEIFGTLLNQMRNTDSEFELPTVANMAWAGPEGITDGLQHAKYMVDNNLEYTYESAKADLDNLKTRLADVDELFVTSPGICLFVDQFMQEYPDSAFYFCKRVNSDDILKSVKFRADRTLVDVSEEVLTHLEELNSNITSVVDAKLDSLGYEWTEGNTRVLTDNLNISSIFENDPKKPNTSKNEIEDNIHKNAVFLFPSLVAVYKPEIVINFFG